MEKLKINIDNEKYYTEDFIKGWKTGVEAQFKADVQEQQPKGEWVPNTNGDECKYICSKCLGGSTFTWHFCPNCGAKMRE